MAMARYIALLRAVNVGGTGRITMPDFRDALAGLGCTDVKTYLQTGNAVFTADEQPPDVLAQRIGERLPLATEVLIRTPDELRAVLARNELPTTDPARLLVTFLATPPEPDAFADLDPAKLAPEAFQVGEREVYLWCPNGVGRSPLATTFAKRGTGTARNWNTVTKLLALTDG